MIEISDLSARLDKGANQYGNQSFVRPVAELVDEVRQELLDEVGWLYVIWCVAARKANFVVPEADLRQRFIDEMRHRIERNDRGAMDQSGGGQLGKALIDLQVLGLDAWQKNAEFLRRLEPIARSIEVAVAIQPYRGRRGGTRDPRSDD